MPLSPPQAFARYFPVSIRDRRWGFHVTSAGQSRIPPRYAAYPPLRHPAAYHFAWEEGRVLKEYAMVYISRGGGRLESASGRSFSIREGDVFLLFPGVWHRYRPHPRTGWDEHWLHFGGAAAERMMRQEFFPPSRPVIRVGREMACLQLFSEALEAIKTHQPALQQVLGGIAMHLVGLLYSARQTRRRRGEPGADGLAGAVQYLRAHLTAPINMPSLARQFHASYSTFRHTFVRHTGMSPLQYLLELRMAYARGLLRDTRLPVGKVAALVGFEDEHYFNRLFRKRVGEAPGQWRRRPRNRADR